ncbi:SDR family oxidoreductase [Sphingoaurantiacus capsulatus]|uniref:SDR family oxidoreductase n=1 Tax=Sphingoaurantiacus capsulatus TaxID=1771310 RepID=A0ABV7XDW1_9SPHN
MTSEFGQPRTAIVTGAAKRIGAAMARALAADGWHVVIHCNNSTAEAEGVRAEIVAAGGHARIVQADLAGADAAKVIAEAASEGPPIGLLVNNASRFDYDTHDDFGLEQWTRHMDVNLRAPALLTQAFARALPEGLNGLVVNMLDVKLFALNPDFFSYTISKYGLLGLTELSARALAPRIRVNGIAPAVTMVSGPQSRANFSKAHTHNPLGRGVQVEEIVSTLRYIVATPTLHGQVITLDAGQRLLGMPRDVAFMVGDE